MGKRIVRTDLVMVSAALEAISVEGAGHRLWHVAVCCDLREQVWNNIKEAHDFEYGFKEGRRCIQSGPKRSE